MFIDIMENNKNRAKSLLINSRRTASKNLLLKFDDFFACFWHKNRFICIYKAVFPTDSNRTFMELKFSLSCFECAFLTYSNRTFMELKYGAYPFFGVPLTNSNRTFMELKLNRYINNKPAAIDSNRTFMELK